MSIQHFDKQSSKRQKIFLEHPEQFVCQEKIDGTFIHIQCDQGQISIFRKDKQVINPVDWGINFWTTNYREAHTAIVQLVDKLKGQFGDDFVLLAEILSVNHPNTIQYDQAINRIVIFNPHDITFQARTTVVDFSYPATYDGINTVMEQRTTDWEIITLPTIPQIEWLSVVKNVRDDAYNELLNRLVVPTKSMFGNGSIEGLVFRHDSGWQFKLVLRDQFTALNNSNQALRRRLFRSAFMRDNTIMDQYTRASIVDRIGASQVALLAIDQLHDEYKQDPNTKTLDAWVNLRNLEALASTRNQIQETINGR